MKTILLMYLEEQMLKAFENKDLYLASEINNLIEELYKQEGVFV